MVAADESRTSIFTLFLKEGTLALCWFYQIVDNGPKGSQWVWVNAITGETVNELPADKRDIVSLNSHATHFPF